jgi:phage terminase large subunit-like protein
MISQGVITEATSLLDTNEAHYLRIRGVAFHLGAFGKLEDQLCALTPDFDARASGFSPDRADALVWAVADLIALERAGPQGLIDFYAEAAKGG